MCLFFSIFFNRTVYAQDIEKFIPISISINDQYVMTDANPLISEDYVYVPLRTVTQALGVLDITWHEEDQSVSILDNDKEIVFFLDSTKVLINGEEKQMSSKPIIDNNRTLVPIRFISENLGFDVFWNEATYTVDITKDDVIIPEELKIDRGYTDEDLYWLSKIVEVEARGLSFQGKLAVANVVVNRRDSSAYPSTIYEVIYDKAYVVQFPPAHKSTFTSVQPSRESIISAKMALEGYNNAVDCFFFNNVPFNSSSIELYKVIDGEYFYKNK